MRRLIPMIVCMGSFSCSEGVVPDSRANGDLASSFEKANAHLVAREYEEALEALPDLELLVGFDRYIALGMRGDAYVGLDRDESAAESYQEAIDIAPGTPDDYVKLANVLIDMSRSDEAMVLLDSCRNLLPPWREQQLGAVSWATMSPGEETLYLLLARLRTNNDQPDVAKDVLEEGLLRNTSSTALFELLLANPSADPASIDLVKESICPMLIPRSPSCGPQRPDI